VESSLVAIARAYWASAHIRGLAVVAASDSRRPKVVLGCVVLADQHCRLDEIGEVPCADERLKGGIGRIERTVEMLVRLGVLLARDGAAAPNELHEGQHRIRTHVQQGCLSVAGKALGGFKVAAFGGDRCLCELRRDGPAQLTRFPGEAVSLLGGCEGQVGSRRYEAAVPPLDTLRIASLLQRRAGWDDVVADADTEAPHGFLVFWRNDFAPLMALAGNTRPCTSYLMGNHVIAEQMYRHDPAAGFYASLRTAILAEPTGHARFLVDQPSTCFSSLGNPAITDVGLELDRKLAALLTALDVNTNGAL
jgi:hypothetical protein